MDAGVPESTLIAATEVTLPPEGGVTLAGENPTWTPLGTTPSVARITAELKLPRDVTVTVSVAEPPEPTDRVGELSAIEKSAPEVIVSANDVV